jgi:hypothetical protein
MGPRDVPAALDGCQTAQPKAAADAAAKYAQLQHGQNLRTFSQPSTSLDGMALQVKTMTARTLIPRTTPRSASASARRRTMSPRSPLTGGGDLFCKSRKVSTVIPRESTSSYYVQCTLRPCTWCFPPCMHIVRQQAPGWRRVRRGVDAVLDHQHRGGSSSSLFCAAGSNRCSPVT